MSGTSADGIDVALVDIRGGALRLRVQLDAFNIYPYPKPLQKELIEIASGVPISVTRLCQLNVYIAEQFSEAILRLAGETKIDLSAVDLIGSHGQTVQHCPTPIRKGKKKMRSTLQLGEPSVIAERTGITTIADFRPRDMAAGGEGAPLTPYLHYHLLRHPKKSRVIINLGGISNVTYLKAGGRLDETIAFDTGPANILIDGLVSHLTQSKKRFDRNGAMAKRGSVHPGLYSELMRHPYLKRKPPKSTGREIFGAAMLQKLLQRQKNLGLSDDDLIATTTAFTAGAIAIHLKKFILKKGAIDEVIVGGGGVRNPVLMGALRELLSPFPVLSYEDIGYDSRAIEAMTFAVLAYQTFFNRPTNIPSVTGADHPVVLGKIIPGRFKASF